MTALTLCVTAAVSEPPPLPSAEAGADRYVKRLDWRAGEPALPVRLMERARQVRFRAPSGLRVQVPGAPPKTVEAPGGTPLVVKLREGRPAKLRAWLQIAELRFADRQGLAEERKRWEAVGVKVAVRTLGSVAGIRGKVLDNRRQLLLVDEPLEPADVPARQAALLQKLHLRTTLFEELVTPPAATLELQQQGGELLATSTDGFTVESRQGDDLEVLQVEHSVGYAAHGFEDRIFRGSLKLVADRFGLIAVVNQVPLEQLLMGLVPAEIYARAHLQALQAQAVTARGEVLAKVGLKHLADPYLLCSEQHCAVYRGRGGEAASTNAAVAATRGQAAFSPEGRLVDSVYSAVCGGHTENNEAVWGGQPDPSLRGKPDLLEPRLDAPSPRELKAFLDTSVGAACERASLAQPGKFRWHRRFAASDVDARMRELGVGRVLALTVADRGVSGRARVLTVSGEAGATQIRGELEIRKRFAMLESSLFEITTERDQDGLPKRFIFDGGGWGHGVGLCQTGAIGRAEAGQDYRAILRHYFNGAETVPLY